MRARSVYRLSLVILSFATIVNVVVAVRVMLSLRNPVNYNFRIVEPPVFTNLTSAVGFPGRVPGSPVEESPQPLDVSTNNVVFSTCETNQVQVAVESYHYMRVGGSPCVRLNGYNYRVGDLTAYGVITAIFPERVYLDSGYISNSRRVFDVVDRVDSSPFVVQPVIQEVSSNDERRNNS